MTDDPYEHYDAPYVLGALTSGDRREYERHLEECVRCAQAVRELSGMPGLMAKARPIEADTPAPPLPDTLLPRLLAIRDRERRRRRWWTAGIGTAAAAAAGVIVAVGGAIFDSSEDAAGGSNGDAVELAFEQVVDSPVHAFGDLNDVDWGTRIDINCTYDEGRNYRERSYKMVVISEDGVREQVAVWKVRPGQDVELTGSTDLNRGDIAAIHIVDADGTSLLRAEP